MEVRPRRRRRKTKQRSSFSWKKKSATFRSPECVSDGVRDSLDSTSTSDYSSCSCSSGISSASSSLSGSQLDGRSTCSDHGWVLDDDGVQFDMGKWSTSSSEEFRRDTRSTRTLRYKDVTVIIPEYNLSGYTRDTFYLEFIEDPCFVPLTDPRTLHVSRIVAVGPHGARFADDRPALIYLPVTEKVGINDRLVCLYSNTCKAIAPRWKEIPRGNFSFKGGQAVIQAHHFSLFTVVLERYPEVRRRVTSAGATLWVPEVPGVEVRFPPNAVTNDTTAFVRVFYDSQPCYTFSEDDVAYEKALASPIVMVGPHGCSFDSGSEPVVQLPIPHYPEILQRFGQATRLTVWQSSPASGDPLVWEKLDVTIEPQRNADGLVTLSFPVHHFSFFKALWDILASSMYEAKLGVAYFYPYISFSMMCQAWMEENKDTQRFGLEILCYRSDKNPDTTNYKHKVGRSLKPKLVKPGCIVVRLKTELFVADVEAGEDPSLIKLEPDFRGREFEKQFACRFKQEKPAIDRGTFGKVIVERQLKDGQKEPLFEFNLNKTGCENESSPYDSSDRWSVVAIKELAGTLRITEDGNWKKFARHIGFTKNEVQAKLAYTADPFLAMMNLYQQRGGTPEEFVQALYEVSRQLQVPGSSASAGSGSPTNSVGGSTSGRKWGLWNFTPTKWRDKDDSDNTSDVSEATSGSRKRSQPSGSSGGSAAKRRRRFSDVSETMSSSEESSVTEDLHSDTRKLTDTDMWRISSLMDTMNWRALGRTLGLEESVLLNIEHAYKSTGFRECAYQMFLEWKGRQPKKCTLGTLYTALCKENLNSIAKQLATIKLGSS